MSAVATEHKIEADQNWGLPPRIWWRRLKGDLATKHPEDRATMAQLRRCHGPLEAFFVPATLRLLPLSARATGGRDAALEVYGAIAVVLAHVRDDVPDRRVAQMIGRERLDSAEPPIVSEGRFRHLLQVQDVPELMIDMRRVVRQLGGTANVDDLARSMLWWFRGQGTRRRWAFDYYGASNADPGAVETSRT